MAKKLWLGFRVKHLVVHRVGLVALTKYLIKVFIAAFEDKVFRIVPSESEALFVVGCGHSGTTLMAAKMGNHRDIFALGRKTEIFFPHKNSLFVASRMLFEWGDFARIQDKSLVLEKTPKHLYFIDSMERVAPGFRVVVMIRNPLDTIASLFKRFGDIELCIERWINDNREVLKIRDRSNVMLVRYEDMTAHPERVFVDVCHFIGREYDDDILSSQKTVFDVAQSKGNMIIRAEQVSSEIQVKKNSWKSVFSEDEAANIWVRTSGVANELGYKDEFGFSKK
ncbi:MAG: sulfotransferase [Thalassolituus sp.]|jgi:hypothetical protein